MRARGTLAAKYPCPRPAQRKSILSAEQVRKNQEVLLMQMFRHARWLLLTLLLALIPASIHAQGVFSVGFAPPEMPSYEQPYCPEPNMMWMPGYWAYDQDQGDYYWVPGAWVEAPYDGALWTPPYWGWYGGHYRFHNGYWGSHVGYYGGVDYGYGYGGIGYSGGEWQGNNFRYNTAITRVDQNRIHSTYSDRTVVANNTIANHNRVAYSGGPGGIQHTAQPSEQLAARDKHTAPTSFQTQQATSARSDKTSFAKSSGVHQQNVVAAKPLGPQTRTPASGQQAQPKSGPQSHAAQQQAHPAQQQQAHPAQQQASPATKQQAHPAQQQQAHPAQQQQAHPAQQQQAHPAQQQQAHPAQQQQAHPAQQQQARPAQQHQARPAQQQQARPAQQQQQARPAQQQQQARPAQQQQARPAQQQQQARPAQQQQQAR